MAKIQSNQSLLDELAESFAERYRRGERPSIDEYVQQYPDLADQIGELFPALMMMERVDDDLRDEAAKSPLAGEAAAPITQLGDYRIIREVGRGGMGVVYEAEQVSLGRRVALKVLPKQLLSQPKLRKRFEREARAAGKLHHTNIVPVFGVGQQDGMHYYVMQFIDGLGLDEVLVELQRIRHESGAGGAEASDGKEQASDKQQLEQHRVGVGRATEVAQSLVRGQFEQTWIADSSSTTPRESEDSGRPRVTSGPPKDVRGQQPGLGCDSGATLVDSQAAAPDACRDTAAGHVSDTLPGSDVWAFPGLADSHSRSHSRSVYWRSVASIGLQAAEALQHAHDQGIIHRDIKPANLLLDMGGCVWVTDFGLAKATDQQDLTHSGDVLGTLRYMAPEQFDGQADSRSDIYSLGLTLYELLALQPGFDERERRKLIKQVTSGTPARLRTINARIPRDLETIVHKAIDRDPAHRYPTAGELAADLQRYLDDEPIKAKWVSPVTRMHRWCKRNPAIAALTSTIAVLLVLAAVASSVAAVRFQKLASTNARLAANLTTALDDAQDNLGFATTQQRRAEGNLDLALTALDAVYLDAIGTEKLLGEPRSRPQAGNADFTPSARAPLTDLEKELLRRGLKFYDQFAQHNAGTPRAAVQTAQAYYRVGLLEKALGDTDSAESAFLAAIERFEKLTTERPDDWVGFRRLGEARRGLAFVRKDWRAVKTRCRAAIKAYTRAIELCPDNAHLLHARSCLHFFLNDFAAGAADLEAALQMDQDNVQYLMTALRRYKQESKFLPRYKGKTREVLERLAALAGEDPDVHLSLGQAYQNPLGDHENSLRHFNRAVDLSPNSAVVLAARGAMHREFGEHDRALADANRAVQLDPSCTPGYAVRACAYRDLGQPKMALAEFNRAVELNPFHGHLLEYRGGLLLQLGDYEGALDDLNRAVELKPQNPFVRKRRAQALFHFGRYAESLADLKKALDRNPKDTSTLVWIPLADVAQCPDESFKQGLLKLADASLEHANADKPQCYLHRAKLQRVLGKHEQAKQDLARASELATHDARFQIKLANYHREAGLEHKALDYFNKAIQLDSSRAHHWNHRGMCYHRLGLHEKARDDYSQAIECDPKAAAFWSNRALSQLLLQAYQEAIEDASKAIELQPKHALAHKWRAQGHAALKQWPEAIADYTTLIDLEPKNSGHLVKRGQARLAAGDEVGAKEDFAAYLQPLDLAVAENPDDWQAWNRRGVALTNLERWEAANADFEKAAEMAPEKPVIHQNRAANLIQQERWKDAADALAKAVQLEAKGWRPNYELALCCLGAGDVARYREACARMVEDGVTADDALRASFTAWTCAVAPDAVDDYTPLVTAATHAAEQSPDDPHFQNSLGALLYRAGQLDEAMETLEGINESHSQASSSPAYTWYFLAMTHHALGETEEARRWLDRANEWTERVLSDENDPPAWNRRLSLHLLRDEANKLIEVENSLGPGHQAERPASPPPSAETKP